MYTTNQLFCNQCLNKANQMLIVINIYGVAKKHAQGCTCIDKSNLKILGFVPSLFTCSIYICHPGVGFLTSYSHN